MAQRDWALHLQQMATDNIGICLDGISVRACPKAVAGCRWQLGHRRQRQWSIGCGPEVAGATQRGIRHDGISTTAVVGKQIGSVVASLLATSAEFERACRVMAQTDRAEFRRLHGAPLLNCFLSPNTASIAWTPDGSSYTTHWCGTTVSKWRYGVPVKGYAEIGGYYYGGLYGTRNRKAICPVGYAGVGSDPEYPDYCIKTACSNCPDESVGNPLSIATAEKKVFETDYAETGPSSLRFSRSYSNLGHYRARSQPSERSAGFGDFWRHSYSHRVLPEDGVNLAATVLRPNASERHFRPDGREAINLGSNADRLTANTGGGWTYRGASGSMEVFAADGTLAQVVDANGYTQTSRTARHRPPRRFLLQQHDSGPHAG